MGLSSITGDQRTNSTSSLIIFAVNSENKPDALSVDSSILSEGFSLKGRISSIFDFLSTLISFDLFILFFMIVFAAIIMPKIILANVVNTCSCEMTEIHQLEDGFFYSIIKNLLHDFRFAFFEGSTPSVFLFSNISENKS